MTVLLTCLCKRYGVNRLGTRYMIIAIIFITVLLASSLWSMKYIAGHTSQAENTLRHTTILHTNTAQIRNHLWYINYALQAYMITPGQGFKQEIDLHLAQLKKGNSAAYIKQLTIGCNEKNRA